ncbi:MAG: branched-chain amino acid transaminase [Myxococcota bacterium]
MSFKASFIWFNGKIVPWEDATVHVMTHALHYGSSVFEGIRAYETSSGTALFRLKDHTHRLLGSARIYRMEVCYDADELGAACKAVIEANGLSSAYVRPLVFRGVSGLSLAPDGPTETAIAAFPWGTYLGEGALEDGVDVCVSTWNRPAPNTFPMAAKAGGNYLSGQLMALEAKQNGYAEAIALDSAQFVSEGSGENIFVVKDETISTPPAWSAILPGLTRDTIMRLAVDLGYQVKEEVIPREALYLADEIFLTGTAAEVTPVRSVDRIAIGSGRRGPITAHLQEAFFGLFSGRTPDRYGWLDFVREPEAVLRMGA